MPRAKTSTTNGINAMKTIAKKRLLLAALWFTLALPIMSATTIGVTVGYAVNELADVQNQNTFEPPLASPYDRDSMQWWYNTFEEIAFSNIPFAALVVRGQSLNGTWVGNAPATMAATAVTALNQRGYNNVVKLALFDDTAAYPGSFAADHPGTTTMDLSNQENWRIYWWENKWRQFFQAVPDSHRMKIQGRPLVLLWRVDLPSPAIFTNINGNLKALISFLRQKCAQEFGFNPFIIADKNWIDHESAVSQVVDGVHNWFSAAQGISWTKYTHNGPSGSFTSGIVTPGFSKISEGLFLDREFGNRFLTGLSNTIPSSDLVIIEGHTDVEENAGIYRGAVDVVSPSGSPPIGQRWLWPNQYLNDLREFSAPFPKFVIFEAETCDFFNSPSSPQSGGIFRRAGNLAIDFTDGTMVNWAVTLNAAEWVGYNFFELGGSSNYLFEIDYSSDIGATVQLVIDYNTVATLNLPSTGSLSAYSTALTGKTIAIAAGSHEIRVVVVNGRARLNKWKLDGL